MIRHILFMAQAWAGEAGHHVAEAAAQGHDAHAIPWSTLFVQAFNFTFLIVVLFLLLRKAVKVHFEHRARSYQELVERAEAARSQAERGKREIADRLAKLESTADQGLVQARAEAAELKSRILLEAKNLSEKLQAEAQRTALVELEKAKTELRRELLTNALQASRESCKRISAALSKSVYRMSSSKKSRWWADEESAFGIPLCACFVRTG
ncbi:MAG: ATP synthase F0 subunit B [Calothrix sp. SM1_5_4]|nr:ATP synthase F0 subunit B [Calothrix sp. SM1_5_4]